MGGLKLIALIGNTCPALYKYQPDGRCSYPEDKCQESEETADEKCLAMKNVSICSSSFHVTSV